MAMETVAAEAEAGPVGEVGEAGKVPPGPEEAGGVYPGFPAQLLWSLTPP